MNDLLEEAEKALGNDYGEEKKKELKYTKVEGEEDIYAWEKRKGG